MLTVFLVLVDILVSKNTVSSNRIANKIKSTAFEMPFLHNNENVLASMFAIPCGIKHHNFEACKVESLRPKDTTEKGN